MTGEEVLVKATYPRAHVISGQFGPVTQYRIENADITDRRKRSISSWSATPLLAWESAAERLKEGVKS